MESMALQSFSRWVGDTFSALREGIEAPLVLVEAVALESHGGEGREPFSLLFHGHSPAWLEQAIYRVRHPAIGECEIFLVPVGRHESGFVYQAVFN
ncbi:MAG: hypothetical protein KGJ63_09750 [Pseudomonadota bacterium]|nr:hypothetical protein [Pseudomonadota bacterium]